MAYTLRTREQRIVELDGIETEIALNILEPFRRIARGILQSQHFKPSFILVATKCRTDIRFAVEIIRERYRALHGEF